MNKILVNGDSINFGEEIYSTEETKIGTWIDGRPIYRKVFTNLTSYGTTGIPAHISDFLFPINLYAIVHYNNNYVISNYQSGAGAIVLGLYDNGDIWQGCTLSTAVGKPMVIIAEYTKTTDYITA